MISSRGQYKFVAPPEWMEIDGGILPARDVADDGSAAILRGEDACFLAEASFRAKLYRNYGTTYAVPSVGGEIDSAVVGEALSRIRDYPSHSYNYVKYAIPGTPAFEGSYVKDVGTGDVVQGVISSGVYLFSPATPSGPIPGPLDSDLMRRAYYDLRKSGCYVFDGDLGSEYRGTPAATFKNYSYDGEHGWSLESQTTGQGTSLGGVVVDVNKAYYDVAGVGGNESTYDWDLTTVVPAGTGTSVPTPLARLVGSQVYCNAVFAVTVVHRAQGADSVTYNDAIVVQAEIDSDGTLYVGSLTAADVKSSVVGARGVPTTWETVANGEHVGISVSPRALVFYDPEIDTSEIEWEWEPPSAE